MNLHVNKKSYLTLTGIALAIAGAFIITSSMIGGEISRIVVPLLLAGGGLCSLLFSLANQQHKIASRYHMAQGIGLMLFGVLIIFIPKSLEGFLTWLSYFMLMFGMFELIFAFSVLNSGEKFRMNMLIARLITGILTLLGAIGLLVISLSSLESGLYVAGILVLLSGLAWIMFVFKLK